MAASAQLKSQTQTQPTKTKRRKRRDITNSPSDRSSTERKRLPATVVSSDSAWCCSTTSTAPLKSSPSKQKRRTATPTAPPPQIPEPPEPPKSQEPLSVTFTVKSPSPSPFTIKVSPSRVSPLMDSTNSSTAFAPFLSGYSKFNSALNAGLLNPMSPPPPSPLEKTRSSPTLFQMMANEQDCLFKNQSPAIASMPAAGGTTAVKPPASIQDRQQQLQDQAATIFGDPMSSDVKLKLSSKDGLSVSINLHRQILAGNSEFFAAKISDRWNKQQKSPRSQTVEIPDCDDVETYMDTLQLMYCKDLRKKLMKEDVSKVLAILKVSAAIVFGAGVVSCLEYLEAAPWAEDEEEKISSLISQLHLENAEAVEVLKRVSLETPVVQEANEEVLSKLLQVVLQGKDEKARRDMKGLVAKMLRENSSQTDLSKESLYSACNGCLDQLRLHFHRVAKGSPAADTTQIARQADNLHWILEILIDRQIADEFLKTWANQLGLSEAHAKIPAVHRYEVSRVSARLFVGIGKGQILVSKEVRCLLLQRWLEPFYDDYAWMRRACKGLDRHLVEDGLCNTILTLPIEWQQEILLGWFDRFLNAGDDCPNLQRAFEVWWRRAFWRRSGEAERPKQLRIVAATPAL